MSDFFAEADKDREKDLDDFFNEISLPKEEIEANPYAEEWLNEEEEAGEDQTSSEENDMIPAIEQGHLQTAQFFLNSYNHLLAFGLSMYSGEAAENYRIYKNTPDIKAQEVQLAAAIIQKYSVKTSIESMFIMALIFISAPVFVKAKKDKRKNVIKKQKEEAKIRIKEHRLKTDPKYSLKDIDDPQIL